MITKAAIKKGNKVYTGFRHNEIIKQKPFGYFKNCTQGFVNHSRKFMDREQAAKHAFECGQIPEQKQTLYSEDLW